MIHLLAALLLTTTAPDACEVWVSAQPWATGSVHWIDAGNPEASDAGDGTAARPWRTPSAIRRPGALRPGDALVLRGGLYRDALRPAQYGAPGRPITFASCPGESVVISGADPWKADWQSAGPDWAARVDVEWRAESRYSNLLIVADGAVLRPVAPGEPLGPGRFRAETEREGRARVTVRLADGADPRTAAMEIGRRGTLFGSPKGTPSCPDNPEAGWFRLVGLRFVHSASPAQRGAVCIGGQGSVVEDVTVSWSNALGIEVRGAGHVLRRTGAEDNGQAGIGGSCTGCRLEDTWSIRNNWRGHDRFWEAGGGKWTNTHGTEFIRHTAVDNDGVGLWLDWDASDNTIDGAWLVGNVVAGLMLELGSDRNTVVNSVIARTARRGWSASGILVQAASDNEIRFNSIVENAGSGIWLRADKRRPTGSQFVENNDISRNGTDGNAGDRDVRTDGRSAAVPGGSGRVPMDFDGEPRPEGARVPGAFGRDAGAVFDRLDQPWHEVRSSAAEPRHRP